MTTLLLALALSFVPIALDSTPSVIQAPAPVTITPDTAFLAAADHSGLNTTEYWLENAGVVVEKKPVSALTGLTGGTIQFTFASGVPAGTHSLAIRAVRVVPQGAVEETMGTPWTGNVVDGQPFTVTTSVPAPAAPTLPVTQIKLYRQNVPVQTQPVTGPTVSFSVTGLPAGPAEFKFSTVSTATALTSLASPALDSTITVIATTQTVSPSISATPSSVVAGTPQTIGWSCTTNCGTIAKDWIGLFRDQVTQGGDIWWMGTYLVVPSSGSFVRNAPTTPGNYVWAYCKDDGYNCPAQFKFTVTAAPVNCVVSAWSAWSAWAPINATTEQRTRTRTVVTPAANGGTPCPALTETETRPITIGTVTTLACTYALTYTVTTQNNVATVSAPVITGSCK